MPKNIVLCSDGTGNSPAKRGAGTNVWKIFRSVDIHHDSPRQLAFYDDGVGTESFKFLKILGGAFGYGISRNICDLYRSLVHHYDPGDQIYLFGFSRGAFTVRSLAGFIGRCGVVKREQYNYGRRLDELTVKAFKIYKDNDPKKIDAFRRKYSVENPEGGPGCEDLRDIPIKMIGVWDTVDAVGLPIDELTDAFDPIFHFRFPNTGLMRCVEHGYHALAIDDERHTFHPVMWNEKEDAGEKTHQKVEQVWFAGMHSNVGGGYPKDQMALVPLDWMMRKAEGCGLHFRDELRKEFSGEANPLGKIYDSRSGLGAYYRYRPRNLAGLCRGNLKGKIKIHASVFERIGRSTGGYTPISLPGAYEVVDADAETPREKSPRERYKTLSLAWDIVWWRRLIYFCFVALSLLLVGMGVVLANKQEGDARVSWGILDPIFDVATWAAPAALEDGIEAYRNQPFWPLAFLVSFAVLLTCRAMTKSQTREVCVVGWRKAFNLEAGTQKPGPLLHLARRIRRSGFSRNVMPSLKKEILPTVALLFSVALLGFSVWKIFIQTPTNKPPRCGYAQVPLPLDAGESRTVDFDTTCSYHATRVILEEGAHYRFEIEVTSQWLDATIEAGPAGFKNKADGDRLRIALPFRRSWSEDWFTLLGDIGPGGGHRFVVGETERGRELVATETGRLYLYVNDAVCFWCPDGPWHYYEVNNQGTARITVTRLPAT